MSDLWGATGEFEVGDVYAVFGRVGRSGREASGKDSRAVLAGVCASGDTGIPMCGGVNDRDSPMTTITLSKEAWAELVAALPAEARAMKDGALILQSPFGQLFAIEVKPDDV